MNCDIVGKKMPYLVINYVHCSLSYVTAYMLKFIKENIVVLAPNIISVSKITFIVLKAILK